nr:hypothetical protein [Tanacetum cinerariifolium]
MRGLQLPTLPFPLRHDHGEEEEHLAPADSIVVSSPTVDHVPSAKETEPFETDAPIPFPSEEKVAKLLALPTPPPSPLTPLSSPLP